MHLPTVPTKTLLGQEELRRRTGGLGQRHRTILFLIDGRRPLSEVLSLAHQAGAATAHFEDLVRMGFVELPPEEPPAPAPAELAEAADSPDAPAQARITHLDVEVRAGEAEWVDELQSAPADIADVAPPPAEPVAPAMPVASPVPVAPSSPPPLPPEPVAEFPSRPFLPPSRQPVAAAPPRPARPPAAPPEDLPLAEQVRAQLLEALRHDAQPAGSRIAQRLRQAQGTAELIEVVWVMERGLRHSQRTHRGLLALQRARELLGLGNTLVDEESVPDRPDDDWV